MKLLTLIAVLLVSSTVFAQKQGTITYEETVKLDIKIPEGMEEVFAKMPKERTTTNVLYFNADESLYLPKKDKIGSEDDEVSMESGGFHLKFKMNEPDNRTYINRKEGKITLKQDLLGKSFLIEKPIVKYNWKIGTEMQRVANHVCMQATAVIDDSTSVVAWFTSDIPISLGPQEYQGLPGAILALEYNGDERILVAKEVDLSPPALDSIVRPDKGKRVTTEEYEEIRKRKMAEMNAEHGGRGVRIITRNN